MTYEEAKRVLTGLVGYLNMIDALDEPTLEGLRIGIAAIEKQIPKMVKNKSYLGRINAENIYYGECPACGKGVGSALRKKWCDQCGQSLEWSDA